jgi:hypothetical protein
MTNAVESLKSQILPSAPIAIQAGPKVNPQTAAFYPLQKGVQILWEKHRWVLRKCMADVKLQATNTAGLDSRQRRGGSGIHGTRILAEVIASVAA